jgi:HEPN domain-containing protein
MRARKDPNYDGVCFHAQQCAEKYLKARLQEANIAFSKTHDLIKLLKAVLAAEPTWNVLEPELIPLTDFSVEYRYPGISATRTEAKSAGAHCRKVRRVVRRALGLRG